MSQILEIYDITKKLHQHLVNTPVSNDRNDFISKINAMLDQRETLINAVDKDLLNDDQEILRKIVDLNKKINPILQNFLREIGKDLSLTKQKVKVVNKYESMYDSLSTDGMFFDKKK